MLSRTYDSLPIRDAGDVEQAHDHRQHLVARQPGQREVAAQSPPQLRERFAERDHAVELRVVAQHAPLRVIAVLLAPPRVAAGRLQMSVRVRADPHAFVCGRNGETGNALQRGAVPDGTSVGMAIDKAVARAHADDPRLGIADIDESGRSRHAHCMDGGWREFDSDRWRSPWHDSAGNRLCDPCGAPLTRDAVVLCSVGGGLHRLLL